MFHYRFSLGLLALIYSLFYNSCVLADVTDCYPSSGTIGSSINLELGFDITTSSGNVSPGTVLANASSAPAALSCYFTGDSSSQNMVYFKNLMPDSIKNMLLNNGVRINQRLGIGDTIGFVTITDPVVPDIPLGSWRPDDLVAQRKSFAFMYDFVVRKDTNNLKPFDTGVFLLGNHVDYRGLILGGPVYVRFIGNLTLLCPSPNINITTSNGGSVNFNTVSIQSMNSGGEISRTFNVNLALSEDCETGLSNISIRFEPNNNTILGNKYLDMGNGLQVLLRMMNNLTDIMYNEEYLIGNINRFEPINVSFMAILNKIPNSVISSGEFSKTIRVVVSY